MSYNMTTGRRILFRTQAEAEAKTGYFSVSSLLISCQLGEKVHSYIGKNKLCTYLLPNQRKTCHNTYTLNFTLKQYHTPAKKVYLTKPGAIGSYSDRIKGTRSEALKELEDLKARSPTLEQMYFWIVRKYPNDLLWMEFDSESLDTKIAAWRAGRDRSSA